MVESKELPIMHRFLISTSAMAWLCCGVGFPAESLRIYSEFRRIDPFGEIVAADQGGRVREILSPGLPRNAYTSFLLAVTIPQGGQYWLHFAQNPANSLLLNLYRLRYQKAGSQWVPDRMEPAIFPYQGTIPEAGIEFRGQTTSLFVMDVRVAPRTTIRRIRLEAQIELGGRWTIYPLEVRIIPAIVPPSLPSASALPPVEASSDASAMVALRGYLCGGWAKAGPGPMTLRGVIRRNALQDMALALDLERQSGRAAMVAGILEKMDVAQRATWCDEGRAPEGLGPEWYYRIRDLLYRKASEYSIPHR